MEKPFVSIIVPIYNVEKYLKQCIDSILNQTLRNIEIILVDDGSLDNCPEMCDEYGKQDDRVTVIHQENGGYGKACNAGFNAARGEYLGIVESDDYIENDMYETLFSMTKKTDSPIIKGSFFHEYNNGVSQECSLKNITNNQNSCEINAKESLYLMLYESSIWSAIYNREFITFNKIKMLETEGASYQDVVWKFFTYSIAESVMIINKPVYHYRVMTQNSSSRNSKYYDAMFVNYSEIKQNLIKNNNFEIFKDIFYLHQFYDAAFHLGRLDKNDCVLFRQKMKDVINEAKIYNITINSFPEIKIPINIRNIYYKISSDSIPIKYRLSAILKKLYLEFIRTKFGNKIWVFLKK